MSDNSIDGTQKRSSTMDDDPALQEENRLRAEFEKQKAARQTKVDPPTVSAQSKMPGGVSYAEYAKNAQCDRLHQDKCVPDDPSSVARAQRGAWEAEKAAIDKRLTQGQYVGRREDEARWAELKAKLDAQPSPNNGFANTTYTTRKQTNGVLVGESGRDGLTAYASGALVRTDRVTVGGASVQAGLGAVDVHATGFRAANGTGSIEVATAHVGAGVGRNDDGSYGMHTGVSGTAAWVEATHHTEGGGSVTIGAGDGVGIEGSVGVKETKPGVIAVCAHAAIGPVSIGACIPVE